MEGILEGDDFVAPLPEMVVGVLTGELDGSLTGLGAAVTEKAAIGERELRQHVGQFDLGLNVVEVGDVQQGTGLLADGFHDSRVTVAQVIDAQPRQKVVIHLTVGIPDPHPFAAHQRDRRPPIGSRHMDIAAVD
jgi:hypothetical protein